MLFIIMLVSIYEFKLLYIFVESTTVQTIYLCSCAVSAVHQISLEKFSILEN